MTIEQCLYNNGRTNISIIEPCIHLSIVHIAYRIIQRGCLTLKHVSVSLVNNISEVISFLYKVSEQNDQVDFLQY